METKKLYNGLDAVKFILAIFVAMRHIIQVFFTADSRAHLWIGSWLSNLAVPSFFMISAYFFFQKIDADSTDKTQIVKYCKKVLKMYLIWSVIYLPTDWYNWANGESGIVQGIWDYVQAFFFSSSIVQLWYLPALCVAALLVWFFYTRGMKIWQILVITGCLFVAGVIGDNWYFNEQLPPKLYELVKFNERYFLTMRNGLFYGSVYFGLGLLFAKTKWRLPMWAAVAGTMGGIGLMYQEVVHCSNTNLVFSAVPAVYCLFTVASGVNWKNRSLYPRLREMSEWIYLSHFYFFYLFKWTTKWNPVPMNNKSIMAMILGAVILFSWMMVRLSERTSFRWLKRII